MTGPDAGIRDVLAVGAGPFNIGLAALAMGAGELDLAVYDGRAEFAWHPGLMFDDADLQVSFLSDLVTLVDPTHPLSFLSYLRAKDRLYLFLVRERFRPTRLEFEDYLKWALGWLPSVRFGHRVQRVRWDTDTEAFAVDVVGPEGEFQTSARNIVLGIGTEPTIPPVLAKVPAANIAHSSDYLARTSDVDKATRVTVIGSGQSGAEIFLDLLRRTRGRNTELSWLTRTTMFAPLDFTKLDLEMTTPAYMKYFHRLSEPERDRLVGQQWQFHKGISEDTLDGIHDELYRRHLAGDPDVLLRSSVGVVDAEGGDDGVRLRCQHRDSGSTFEHRTDFVLAATGYSEREPDFLAPVLPYVKRDGAGRPVVRPDHSLELGGPVGGRIFVANADTHSHGVSAPNLDIGAIRNATILNAITGREVYRLPGKTAFSTFDVPDGS